ncbi:MAG: hypothetical protein F4210_12040 [Holophagales bacterium]|nr:hypothetical protein [Holophagales bacterium]MYF96212.1 hypothetical protein [Holophagales bacterium]
MFTLLKRLAILGALWLAATIGLLTYVNTRSEEQIAADIENIAGPLDAALASAFTGSAQPEPLPVDDVMRAETEATLAEVEALYDQLIATHQALQETHTDQWEKRWAGDAVTLAQMAKESAIEAIELRIGEVENPPRAQDYDNEPWAISNRLDTARRAAASQKAFVLEELATAREELAALNAGPRQ